jgi:hypothetical protein
MSFRKICIQLRRVTHEIVISGLLLWFYLSGIYLQFSPTVQTIALKATLTSLGFLHAHITRKLAFPAVVWGDDEKHMLKLLCIALYVTFIYAYSHGG